MNLRQVLDRNRLKQQDVARGIGVTRHTVGLWVNGRVRPSAENLLDLIDYLRQFEPEIDARQVLGHPDRVAS